MKNSKSKTYCVLYKYLRQHCLQWYPNSKCMCFVCAICCCCDVVLGQSIRNLHSTSCTTCNEFDSFFNTIRMQSFLLVKLTVLFFIG